MKIKKCLSDHYLLFCSLEQRVQVQCKKTFEYRSLKYIDRMLQHLLNEAPFHILLPKIGLSDKVNCTNECILSSFNTLAHIGRPRKRNADHLG